MLFPKNHVLRYRKYLRNARHLTTRKLANILRTEWRYRANNPAMHGLCPYILFVDLSNSCNLKCPLCPTGRGHLIPRDNRMTLENYKKLIEPLCDYLYQVFLFNNTEPFLNKDVYEIIRLNTSSNIGSVVSSNLSLKIDSAQLVDSGLDYLIVSGDGVTQDVYEKYRVHGKVQLVIDNIRQLVQARERAKAKLPFIEWQCLVNRHNETHLREIKAFALSLGVDSVRFTDTNFYAVQGDPEQIELEAEWLPLAGAFRRFESEKMRIPEDAVRKPCHFLWRTAVVNSNGGVNPCCLYDTSDWGNALDESFAEIWNSTHYQGARRLGTEGSVRASETICDKCQAPFIWKRQ
jgi:radical SAM protein with 4Fe4S-binding SPASM domain